MSTEKLWAVHVQGSDDIHAATTRRDAEREKSFLDKYDEDNAHRPFVPRFRALVIEWPGTPEDHAADLADQDEAAGL